MRFLAISVVFVLLAVSAYAADVDGKWSGSVSGPQGEFPVAFTFKADGATLTGATTGFDGAEIPIKDGKIDGKIISFTVTFDFGGMPFVLSYKGIVSPDQIKMSGDAAGMPFEFVLKKDK
jgi:opacity protein-like surface antigen